MEDQLTPLFQSMLSTVRQYESTTIEERSKYSTTLKEKDEQIKMLIEIRDRQKTEMEDFLKVSYARRWKNNYEELEKKFKHHQEKMDALVNINEELNHRLDQITKLESVSTQTDADMESSIDDMRGLLQIKDIEMTIETKKGAIYNIKDNKLIGRDGKVIGEVTQVIPSFD